MTTLEQIEKSYKSMLLSIEDGANPLEFHKEVLAKKLARLEEIKESIPEEGIDRVVMGELMHIEKATLVNDFDLEIKKSKREIVSIERAMRRSLVANDVKELETEKVIATEKVVNTKEETKFEDYKATHILKDPTIEIAKDVRITINEEEYVVSGSIYKDAINYSNYKAGKIISKYIDIKKDDLEKYTKLANLDKGLLYAIDQSGMNDNDKGMLIKDYIKKAKNKTNQEAIVRYNLREISETSFIRLWLKLEMKAEDKAKVYAVANAAAENGLAEIKGQFTRSWKDKLINMIEAGSKVKRLAAASSAYNQSK